MKTSDIFKLIDAGFTHDEIMALESDEPAPADPTPAPADPDLDDPDPDDLDPADPDPAPAAQPEKSAEMKAIEALSITVDKLVKAQQAKNRAGSNTKIVTQTTEDILSNIINPKS